MSLLRAVDISNNKPYRQDAWGRNKMVLDYTLFHGLFTINVPDELWVEYFNGVERAKTSFTSVSGGLVCQGSAGNVHTLMSKRHCKYQPNRGHLFSTAVIFPDALLNVDQEFGLFSDRVGVFFRVNQGVLYACKRTVINGVSQEMAEAITLPDGFDLTKGHVYDIQYQWRGVGNYYFYADLELVHTFNLLGTLTGISMSNPSLPITFRLNGLASMIVGCADVSSEGGSKQNRQRGSLDTEELSLSTAEIPVIAIRIPDTFLYNGVVEMNTRDIALRRITGYADDNTTMRVYYTRDATKFIGTTWTGYNTLNTLEYSVDGNVTIDNLTTNIKRIATARIGGNSTEKIENPDDEYGDFYVTHGDYLIVTMEAKNATIGGSSLEWGAEI
jgi:hypothetical protein